MALNFSENNSHNVTGWEITAYDPSLILNEQRDSDNQTKEFCGVQKLDSTVQGEKGSGLENGTLMPDPATINSLANVVHPEHQPLVFEEQKSERRRTLITAKVVEVSSVYFKFIRVPQDTVMHALVLYDDESSPKVEEMALGIDDESLLPLPGLLKGWNRETRERPNGARDKYYSHPSIKKLFRSVIEVVEYIKAKNELKSAEEVVDYTKSKNKLENAEAHKLEELEGLKKFILSEASTSNANKRKYNGFREEPKFKIRRCYPCEQAKKTREQIELEEFYANAHRNLMNLFTPTMDAMDGDHGNTTESSLVEAEDNSLLKGRKEENGSNTITRDENPRPQNVAAMINALASNIGAVILQDLQNPQPQIFLQSDGILELPNPQQPENPELPPHFLQQGGNLELPNAQHVENLMESNSQQEQPTFHQNGNQELQNPQPVENQEQLNPQQGAKPNTNDVQQSSNGLTEREIGVVQIFAEGLNRGNRLTDRDIDDLMAYSPPLFDPLDPYFF